MLLPGNFLTTHVNSVLWYGTDTYLGTSLQTKKALGIEKFYSGIFFAIITIFSYIEKNSAT